MIHSRYRTPSCLAACLLLLVLVFAGCGGGEGTNVEEGEKGPESVTAYEATQFTKAAADHWQDQNWIIRIRDGAPDGISKDGRSPIWEVYYFTPNDSTYSEMFVIYNRGNVWPNAPGSCKGGEEGFKIYSENEPKSFQVDSTQAYTEALRNGGAEYLEGHPDAQVHMLLRCRADYEAINEDMPAPDYQWIWDVTYREPQGDSETLHIMIDGMMGDFITKELK